MVTTTDMIMAIIMLTKMNMFRRILISSLAAAAIMSCSKMQVSEPYILFEIHGKVVDVDGNPLQGINVIAPNSDMQLTNTNGSFSFYGRSVPSDRLKLTFEDKDGKDNGGDFLKVVKEIRMNEKTPGSATGSFKGTFYAGDVQIVMLSREQDLDSDSDSEYNPS